MATILPLGSVFNLVGSAAQTGVHINMGRAEAVTFVCLSTSGNQVISLIQSIAGSSEIALAKIDTIYKQPAAGGTWTKVTQTAGSSFTNSDGTNNAVAFTIRATELADGYTHIEPSYTNTTVRVALLHGLHAARSPTLLRAPAIAA